MPITFTDDEAYELFLVVDSYARTAKHGPSDSTIYFREMLLPFYKEWHDTNPHKVHPPLQSIGMREI